jgi:signal transduction histidine kinase
LGIMTDRPEPSRQELRHQPVAAVMTHEVYGAAPETSLLELTSEMRRRRISCVVVCRDRQPVGVISERDVVRILCETQRPASSLCAADVMSSPVHTIPPDMLCPEVMQLMRRQSFRRFPVVGADGCLLGLVTQTDLLRASERDLAEYSARLERAVDEKTEQLGRISALKDDLVGMIVHDLKNPLAVILGILDSIVLGRKPLEEAKLRKRLALALDSSHSMLRLVMNLLDITKIETGELKPDRAPVLCQDLVERAVRSMTELAERDGVRLEVTSVARDRSLLVDAALLERVLQNLLSNAIKHSPPGETVEIGSWLEPAASPPAVCLGVTNRGKPIPREYHQKIFDKFAQLEAKSSGKIASTGLGLTFCKLAVEAHGGRIVVDSPLEDDRGACFTCVLPLD